MAKIICAKNFFLEGIAYSTWAKRNIHYLGNLHNTTECKTLNIWPKYSYFQDLPGHRFLKTLFIFGRAGSLLLCGLSLLTAAVRRFLITARPVAAWALGTCAQLLLAMRSLPEPGIHPRSPALAGGSLTTGAIPRLLFTRFSFERILLVKYYNLINQLLPVMNEALEA